MARKRTFDDSITYWFPWKHPMARLQVTEFWPNAIKNGLVGSALWASPLGSEFGLGPSGLAISSFGAFPRKHKPNVGSALRASPFEPRKCPSPHFFARSMSASWSRTCRAWLRPRELYGSTSCCISHGPCQWEKPIFDSPQLRDPSTDFYENWNV